MSTAIMQVPSDLAQEATTSINFCVDRYPHFIYERDGNIGKVYVVGVNYKSCATNKAPAGGCSISDPGAGKENDIKLQVLTIDWAKRPRIGNITITGKDKTANRNINEITIDEKTSNFEGCEFTYFKSYSNAGTGDCQEICCKEGEIITSYQDPPDGARVISGGQGQKCITMREGNNCGGEDPNSAGITCLGITDSSGGSALQIGNSGGSPGRRHDVDIKAKFTLSRDDSDAVICTAHQGEGAWLQGENFGNNCCGDDIGDAGTITNNYLCYNNIQSTTSEDPLQGPWVWRKAEDSNKGVIIVSPAARASYLSKGDAWVKCIQEGTASKIILGNVLQSSNIYTPLDHDYLCYFEPALKQHVFVECCGSSNCENNAGSNGKELGFGGDSKSAGDSVKIGAETYFCSADSEFVTDLDQDESACNSAKSEDGQDLGYRWTGSKCCGDDTDESYNDVGGIGACIKGKVAANGVVLGENNGITAGSKLISVSNGQFLGCNYEQGGHQLSNQPVEVTKAAFCTISGQNFCDLTGKWEAKTADNLRQSRLPGESAGGFCCPVNTCWNGNECIADQSALSSVQPRSDGYRCIAGNWERSSEKTSMDGNSKGYCPRNDQCFVSHSGVLQDNGMPDKNPQCIFSGQYKNDNYCEGGNWNTRTKALADALLSYAGNSFTLYCGNHAETLNYFNYVVIGPERNSVNVEDLFKKGLIGNVCVLVAGQEIYFGGVLNVELEEGNKATISAALPGLAGCYGKDAQGEIKCSDEASYNKNLKTFIYNSNDMKLKSEGQIRGTQEYFEDAFSTAKAAFNTQQAKIIQDGYVPRFSSIFLSKKAGKESFAILDSLGKEEHIIAKYQGTDAGKICTAIGAYEKLKISSRINVLIKCAKQDEDKTASIFAKIGQQTDVKTGDVWTSLTGKLR